MKAVIMAGGEGSRLRPLTCDLPKPMARLCGRPVLEYILDLLCRHGVTDAALTMRYLPDRIVEHFPDSRYRNIELLFVEEDQPLGTAGSVRGACNPADDNLLVISGDALCDFDLTAAMAFHKERGADVTILGKRVDDPREYGLIVSDSSGCISAFVEKPAFSQAISDMANTGIYILSRRALDMIPVDRPYDFAGDLFPKMLQNGLTLVCREDRGYWCDIGDLETYVKCQRDMLEGKVDCDIHAVDDHTGLYFRDARPAGDYTVTAPAYIGRGVRIADGARIEAGSVIDDGCVIEAGARVSGSVVLQNGYIGRRARLTGALVCASAGIKSGAMLFEGTAVGAGAVVGEKATISTGVKIWNNKVVSGSVNLTDHVKTGGGRRGYFDDDGISGQVGVELTPEFCAKLGSAIGSLYQGARIGVGYGPHRSAAVLAAAVAAGVQSTGAGVIDFGENFQAQFEFSVNFAGLKAGVFICGDTRASVRVVGPGGLPASRSLERGIEAILSRAEFVRCGWDDMGDKVEMSGMASLYRSQLIRCAPSGLTGCAVHVRSRNLAVQSLLRETLRRLGCDDGGQLRIEVSVQGDKARVYDPEAGYIPHHKVLTACTAWRLGRGEDVAVPFDAPHVLDDIAQKHGRRLLRYYLCPADASDAEARKLAKYQMWSRDGLMQSVMFLHIVRRAGGLKRLLATLPEYERSTRTLATGESPAGLLRRLSPAGAATVTEGVVLQRDQGALLIRPLKRGAGVKIFAEAHSSETAAELCDFAERLLGPAAPDA